jgi:hypothetical protein
MARLPLAACLPDDRRRQSAQRFGGRLFQVGAVPFGDAGDDGQSQAAARAAVAAAQPATIIAAGDGNPHLASRRGVADGIVDQVADQPPHAFRLARHAAAAGCGRRR